MFVLKELDVTHDLTTTKYTTSTGSIALLIENATTSIELTPSLILTDSHKKVKLQDTGGMILYPRTNTEQVVDTLGNSLQSIIEELLQRIKTLEGKLNN